MSWFQDFLQATVIMLLGMGVTFAFLAVLIFAIKMTAKIVGKYGQSFEPLATSAADSPVQNDGPVVAVITAAVRKFQADKKNNA